MAPPFGTAGNLVRKSSNPSYLFHSPGSGTDVEAVLLGGRGQMFGGRQMSGRSSVYGVNSLPVSSRFRGQHTGRPISPLPGDLADAWAIKFEMPGYQANQNVHF